MALGECITAGKDILVGLSAVSAAIFAYLGLSAWRKELKGKAEYHLAKEVLKSVYKVREAFKHVRNPGIYRYEYPDEMTDHHGHLTQQHQYDGTAHVYQERWKQMDKAFGELEEHHLEAQVEWGPEFQDVIRDLRSRRVELLIAIQQMLEGMKNPHERELTTSEERAEGRSVLYHLESEPKYDKFTPEIEAAVGKFEVWLRPHIKHKG